MSLVTCCPACATMFRVVPDQLKISEGWVRCGHCAEVFDAGAHLQDPVRPAPPVAAPVAATAASAAVAGTARASGDLPTAPVPLRPPPDEASNPPYPPFVLSRSDADERPAAAPADDAARAGTPSSWALPSRPAPLEAEAAASQEEPALEDVSFVRQARRRAFWRRGSVRAVLGLLLLLLSALLAAQFAVQQRDRLAALQPALRPALEMLCQPLACRIAAPRQIDAVVIDSSSFNRLRSDAYRLSVTLKNQAIHEVAMPALELTLTDTQDQPVLRRVLAPQDLGANVPAALGAGAEWSTTLALGVNGNGATPSRIAGYRLLAFYP